MDSKKPGDRFLTVDQLVTALLFAVRVIYVLVAILSIYIIGEVIAHV